MIEEVRKLILKRKGFDAADTALYRKLQTLIHEHPENTVTIWEYDIDHFYSSADLMIVFSEDREFLKNVGFRLSYTTRSAKDDVSPYLPDWRQEGWFDVDGKSMEVPDDIEIVFLDSRENNFKVPIYICTRNGQFNIKNLIEEK